ncbi:tRNA guanosine(34) transglycosylase Tgt [Candidatus Saccharibacteria bacterium]|nr:tRNA guanosine(34) transglycosylase Tgt [Candidatus Saccharibacteria bacterium]MCB9821253.1 tRNA guanosine(34) transglycosylase Tgt [Candidatus Nomurabacteria bacterium]
MTKFTVLKQNSRYGRSGYFETRVGRVYTPVFMPDGTRGAVKSVSPDQLLEAGVEVVLANTYHLHLQPGESVIEELGGLHKFMNWPKPILTDSGGFQVFSLAHTRKITEEGVEFKDPKTGDKVFISPEKSVQIQLALGSDIVMAFDDLTGLSENDRARTNEAFDRTHRWLLRSIAEFNRLTKDIEKRPLLFGIAQGGLDEKLRLKSLKFVQETDVDGIAVGGLSVGESKTEMYKILELLAPHYDSGRPHFLMGVGDPPDLHFAYAHGIDMADCVLPTRNARHGSVWLSGDKKDNLKRLENESSKEVIDQACRCYTCRNGFQRGWFRHQFKQTEPLAGTLASIHNIHYLQQLAKSYRS